MALTLRNVEVAGRSGLDVRLEGGRVAEIGVRLPKRGDDLDGLGGALIPGLCDHHIHLFALAAQARSVVLEGVAGAEDFADRLAGAVRTQPAGTWIRLLGYHESMAGELNRKELDRLAPHHRVRVQHQTGALWMLNSKALDALQPDNDPPGLEREAGRMWGGDRWLRERIGSEAPRLAPLGRQLASYGITMVTDASVTTEETAAAALAHAVRSGDLPVRLTLMSGADLTAPADAAFAIGPVKIHLESRSLPDFDSLVAQMQKAHAIGRPVAVHCVDAMQLAMTLAAVDAAGARPGDRIEHGGVIPEAAIETLKALGMAVVTQSAFIRDRGDRYLADVETIDLDDLYRCASLLSAGVPVAGSSDAPYASPDPWVGIAAAINRQTRGGLTVGGRERLSPRAALGLYLGAPSAPGGGERTVSEGKAADLCLLSRSLAESLQAPDAGRVRATFLGGAPTFLNQSLV